MSLLFNLCRIVVFCVCSSVFRRVWGLHLEELGRIGLPNDSPPYSLHLSMRRGLHLGCTYHHMRHFDTLADGLDSIDLVIDQALNYMD